MCVKCVQLKYLTFFQVVIPDLRGQRQVELFQSKVNLSTNTVIRHPKLQRLQGLSVALKVNKLTKTKQKRYRRYKDPSQLTNNKRTKINRIKSGQGNITTDTKENQNILREYVKKNLYSIALENLKEMDTFLD